MSPITKFSFDTTFDLLDATDVLPEEQEAAPLAPTYKEEDLAAARAEGYSQGHQAGIAEGNTSLESVTTQALNDIAAQLGELAPLCQSGADRCRQDAIGIAQAVARRTVEKFAQESALHVIENILCETLPRVIDEPRVVIRVHNDLLDPLKQHLSSITSQCGFPGSVILLSEPDLQVPDCRIEWADGGADYSGEEILSDIDELIDQYRASIGAETADPDSAEAGMIASAEPEQNSNTPPIEETEIEEQANG